MFENNQAIKYSVIFSTILVSSLFGLAIGSGLYASASTSTTPDYLLGNLSLSDNLTASQISEASDKIANYTRHFVQESKGNLTRMNMLLFDDLEKRNIINELDKQELLSLNIALSEIKPTSNLTLINNDVSSLLEEMATNSSNPMLVTLKSDLKKKINDIGTLVAGNGTGNVTGGITGLPPLTIGDFWDNEHRSLRLTLGCQAAGTAVAGVALGSYIGSICGVILV
jgi:hypothetical protein